MSTSPIEACRLVPLKYEFSFSKCGSIGAAADLVSRRRRRGRVEAPVASARSFSSSSGEPASDQGGDEALTSLPSSTESFCVFL